MQPFDPEQSSPYARRSMQAVECVAQLVDAEQSFVVCQPVEAEQSSVVCHAIDPERSKHQVDTTIRGVDSGAQTGALGS
jgi:hypothetical protein